MKTILAALAILALAGPAHAGKCVPNKTLAAGLKSGFGEVPVVAATTKSAPLLIFANPKTGTFTVVMIGPESSCVVSAGTDFEIIMRGDPA